MGAGLQRQTLTFNKTYFAFAVLIFLIEIIIAVYVHDNFVRPYIGDVLVVILMYCFFRSFLKLRVSAVAIGVLAFAFTIEFLQYFNLVERLGLQHSKLARTVLGTSFSWVDLLAYIIGIAIVLAAERLSRKATLNN